jgi:hypothetical protein
MKRDASALVVLVSVCLLVGCATHPSFQYEPGTAPYTFDCNAQPGYVQEFNIPAPNGPLRLSGFIQIESINTPESQRWHPAVSVFLQGRTDAPFEGFQGAVNPNIPDQFLLVMQIGLKPSADAAFSGQSGGIVTSDAFAVLGVGAGPPIAFELTMNDSHELTGSVGLGSKAIKALPFEVVRANLNCSGTHVRFSNVVVRAQ